MWPTWNPIPTTWHHIMRVMMVSVVVFVSGCTAPGHSLSTPSARTPTGGHEGALDAGDGNGGNGM
jgi:hypothetical protein